MRLRQVVIAARARVLDTARARGLAVSGQSVTIAGTRLLLV